MSSWGGGGRWVSFSQRVCWYVAAVVQLLAIFETAKASRGGPSLQLSWIKFYKEDLEIYKSRRFKLYTTYKCISLFKNREGNFVDLVIVRKKRKFDNNTVGHCSKLAKHHNLVLKVSLRRRVETCDILCHIHAQCNELHLEGLDTWNVTYSISKTLLQKLWSR